MKRKGGVLPYFLKRRPPPVGGWGRINDQIEKKIEIKRWGRRELGIREKAGINNGNARGRRDGDDGDAVGCDRAN